MKLYCHATLLISFFVILYSDKKRKWETVGKKIGKNKSQRARKRNSAHLQSCLHWHQIKVNLPWGNPTVSSGDELSLQKSSASWHCNEQWSKIYIERDKKPSQSQQIQLRREINVMFHKLFISSLLHLLNTNKAFLFKASFVHNSFFLVTDIKLWTKEKKLQKLKEKPYFLCVCN